MPDTPESQPDLPAAAPLATEAVRQLFEIGVQPDLDATVPVAGPVSSISARQYHDLPLPEELTDLLPHGNYSVEGFLGQGGMGAVYQGTQVRLQRPVAIKIMRRDSGKDYDFEERFRREALAMAKLNHPNIVSVIDFGEAGPDYLYIVMELVDGADLMDVIRAGTMTQEMALTLLPQICDALQFAHQHGIVHRDIKPSNIMLTRDGRVKMCDFGLAKRYDADSGFRTQTGTGMGTPDYAAPEQFDPSAQIDHRADIYALGVMIYQMITGQLPRGVWKAPSQRSECAPQWDSIVSRAMQSDPADRYQQASEVKTDVSSITLAGKEGSAGTPARPASSGGAAAKNHEAERSLRAPVKSRAPLLYGLITGVVIIAIGAFFALRDSSPRSGGLQPPSKTTETKPATPPTSAPKAPAPAVKNTPLLALPLPENDWKPLFTKEEWETNWASAPVNYRGTKIHPIHDFKDGLLHLRNVTLKKAQASADGAIRARIVRREAGDGGGISIRDSGKGGRYQVGLTSDGKFLALQYKSASEDGTVTLGQHSLPNPLRMEDKALIEIRVEGDRLIASLNGKSVIEARDQRLTAAGSWGLEVADGWFESVEVQSLSPSANITTASSEPAAIKLWDSPEKLPKQEGVRWENGSVRLDKTSLGYSAEKSRDAILRVSILMSADNAGGASIFVRHNPGKGSYILAPSLDKSHVKPAIELRAGGVDGATRALGSWPLPRSYRPDEWAHLELRVIGDQLTTIVDGNTLGTVQDSALREPGGVQLNAIRTAYFRDIEYMPLDKQPTVATAPAAGTWKPLFTEKEWQAEYHATTGPGMREFKDGLLHVKTTPFWKRQPSSDRAIRARIVIREAKGIVGVIARSSILEGYYKLGTSSDAKSILINYFNAGKDVSDAALGKYDLPKPLKSGDQLLLELRVQGNRLTGLVNGTAVIDAQDERLKAGGEWGIVAVDGWYESVEVQSLDAPASTTAEPWQDLLADPSKLALWDGAAIAGKQMTLPRLGNANLKTSPADGAIRIKTVYAPDGTGSVQLWSRITKAKGNEKEKRYQLVLGSKSQFLLLHTNGDTTTQLAVFPFPQPLEPGTDYEIEFRAVGSTLTAKLNGAVVGQVNDDSIPSGTFAVAGQLAKPTVIKALHFLPLTVSAAATTPALPVSASSSKFPPGQWVKLFTKAEDLPEDLRKPDSGVKWEDGWIRHEGTVRRAVPLPANLVGNYGVRARFIRGDQVESYAAIDVRCQPSLGRYYGISLGKSGLLRAAREEGDHRLSGFQGATIFTGKRAAPVLPGNEYTLEIAVVGQRLIGRYGDSVITGSDAQYQSGPMYLNGFEPVRDIEVINLDGLPEAEALRLLGVDEKGNDVRGKPGATSAAEPWDPKVSRAAAEMAVTKAEKIEIEQDGKRSNIGINKPLPPGDFRFIGFWTGSGDADPTFNELAKRLTIEELRIMIAPSELIHVGVKNVKVLDEESCRVISMKPGLKSAVFQGSNLTDALLRHFSQASRLEVLHLAQCPVTEAGLAHLSKLPQLRKLDLSDTGMTGKAMAGLASAGQLESLVLGKASTLVDAAAIFAGCPKLQRFRVYGPVSHESLSGINRMTELTELGFNHCPVSAAHLTALANAPLLNELILEECTVAEDAWAALPSLKFLTALRLTGMPRSAALDAAVKQMPKLDNITLDGVPLTSSAPATPKASASATKDTPFINSLGMKFVPVPITGPARNASRSDAGVGPTDKQRVLFSVWETRVQDYDVFAKATKREWNKPDFEQGPTHPAAGVSWLDATAFCAWLTERERKAGELGVNERYRLPSDHEWSCAVGIGDKEDAAKLPVEKGQNIADVFPWGTQWPPPENSGNYWSEELRPLLAAGKYTFINGELPGYRDGFATTSPVGSFASNRLGLYDMGGNVWQWCEDWFDKDQKDRVLRGASWASGGSGGGRGGLLSASRSHSVPWTRNDGIDGFRCVLDQGTAKQP